MTTLVLTSTSDVALPWVRLNRFKNGDFDTRRIDIFDAIPTGNG